MADHHTRAGEETEGAMFKLLSFDVYGTLVNTPPANAKAFRIIVEESGASHVDPMAVHQFWEARNIAHYGEPYHSYKEICRISLEEAFREFGISGGTGDLIERYFAIFAEMEPYPDVLPTLEKLSRTHRLALVSNINDDLLSESRSSSILDTNASRCVRESSSSVGSTSGYGSISANIA